MKNHSMRRSDAIIVAAYVAALAAAWFVVVVATGRGMSSPIAIAALADLAATLVIFGFSYAVDNTSVYDAYWSVAPLPIALYWFSLGPGLSVRAALVLGLVAVWGARLTWNWRRGWTGLGHEDWRYADFRVSTGRLYWLLSLVGLHVFPTVQVFLGCLPLAYATTYAVPLGWLDLVAFAVTATGIAFEWIADDQLRRFRLAGRREEVLSTGLWAWSRHPNYFGEMTFWWGLGLFGLAVRPGLWWLLVGAVAITAMFVFASLPLIDRRMLARRPAYAERMKRVSAIVPLPPRRA